MMTEEREQFEAWAKMFGVKPDLTKANGGANYSDSIIDIAWLSWRASRATQPASPALKLPDVPPNALVALCEQMYDHRSTGATVAHDVWQVCIEELSIDAPHTAPIEPICATGGAERVKVSDVEIEQELISLQNGNGQLRGESFYREALKELLAMRSMPIPDKFLNAQQNASGMFEISEDCMCQLLNMLCSKP